MAGECNGTFLGLPNVTFRPMTQRKGRHRATRKRGLLLIGSICHITSGRPQMDIAEVPLAPVGTEQNRHSSLGNLPLFSRHGYIGEGLNSLEVTRPPLWPGLPAVGSATCAP